MLVMTRSHDFDDWSFESHDEVNDPHNTVAKGIRERRAERHQRTAADPETAWYADQPACAWSFPANLILINVHTCNAYL